MAGPKRIVRGGIRRALRLLTRRSRSARPVVVEAYRGYGTPHRAVMSGRVFRQPSIGLGLAEATLARSLADIVRRTLRRGLSGADVIARIDGNEHRVAADGAGFFDLDMPLQFPSRPTGPWHRLALRVEREGEPLAEAQCDIYVPPPGASVVVISDIDDTVMHTGVASKLRMMWALFFTPAESRLAFPGLAALYRALHRGRGGDEGNPMLYVSRGPWAIYGLLEEFFRLHEIPVGPVLFLRDWGMHLQHPLPRLSRGHKLALIRRMMDVYRDLPFVLIGDSGQRDPENYARVVRDSPGRVKAVYIRDVSHDPRRRRAIEALAEEAVRHGTAMVLAADSFAMAEHAARHGLITGEAARAVLAEREQEAEAATEESRPGPARRIEAEAPGQAGAEAGAACGGEQEAGGSTEVERKP
ncbi:MAG: phosphatase domain-containing protein [Acetobacterales bacterium]